MPPGERTDPGEGEPGARTVGCPVLTSGGCHVADGPKTPQENAQEVFDLVKAYTMQETAEPLKGLGDYLKWGVSGAVALGLGLFFLVMALLRGLQQIGIFNGGDDGEGPGVIVPYLAVFVAVAIVAYALSTRITKGLDQ